MNATDQSCAATLSCREQGAGLPVVFLHPTPLNSQYWQPMAERLDAVRAILPDLRGHGTTPLGGDLPHGGFSPVADAPVLSMGQLADDVLRLLDHFKLGNVVLAGCSIGGYVLLEIWRRAPERVRGLAFVCSKPQPDAEANALKRAATIAAVRANGTAEIFDGMVNALTGASARSRRPQITAELRQLMTLSVEGVVAVQAGLALRPDSVPTVATITVPVLAIAGGEDSGITPAEMELFRHAPGGCDFHLLPHAGHFAAFEEPEHVAALLDGWLERFR